MNWTTATKQERIDAIATIYKDGATARLLGEAIGVTRNTIIGFYSRNPDVAAQYPLQVPLKDRVAKNPRKRPPEPRKNRTEPSRPTIVPAPPIVPDLDRTGIPLLELGRNMCRWPVNDAKQGELHLFCGEAGFPYCPHHAEMSRGHGTEGERSADRILKREMVK